MPELTYGSTTEKFATARPQISQWTKHNALKDRWYPISFISQTTGLHPGELLLLMFNNAQYFHYVCDLLAADLKSNVLN